MTETPVERARKIFNEATEGKGWDALDAALRAAVEGVDHDPHEYGDYDDDGEGGYPFLRRFLAAYAAASGDEA